MSYIALYREWRPAVFEDVVEQEHVVRTLRHSVSTGRIAHAYLFCGTRGTGKTTMAHILSRAINCLNPDNGDPCNKCEVCREILSGSGTDVLEIDAASNNSVDNVREIREEVVYAPSRAKYKVYIIDEVHMLSAGAFNALLKTLEEPPGHVVFILATTEPHKLPATILSRCQRFDFRRISSESIVKRLEKITEANGIKMDGGAARLIAKLSDGALRDAISLLDQCISMGNVEISYNDVLSVVGIVNDTFMESMVDGILRREISGILDKVNRLVADGRDIPHFISGLVQYFRNLLMCKVTAEPTEVVDAPADVLEAMKKQCAGISTEETIHIIKELSTLESGLKWATNPRVLLEVALIKICEKRSLPLDENIAARIAALEEMINSGNFTVMKPLSNAGKGTSEEAPFREGPLREEPLKEEPLRKGALEEDSFKEVPLREGALGEGPLKEEPLRKGALEEDSFKEVPLREGALGEGPADSLYEAGPAPPTEDPGQAKAAMQPQKAKPGGAKASPANTNVQLENWPEILSYLKSHGRMSAYTYLLGTRAIRLDEDFIGIVFGPKLKFQKLNMSKAENIEVVEEAAGKVLSREVKVKCLDEENLESFTAARDNSEREKPAGEDEFIKKARKLADSAGAPFEIIDE